MTALRDVNRCTVRPADLIAHQGYSVLVTDTKAFIDGGTKGFFFHQTRFLSRWGIRIDGEAPNFVSANVVDHHFITAYYLAPTPAGAGAGPKNNQSSATGGEVVKKSIELQINAFTGGGLHFDLVITNHALIETEVTLALDLAADFADLNEALSGKRQQQALVERIWTGPDAARPSEGGVLTHRYTHPKLDLSARVFVAEDDAWTDCGDSLACRVKLAPREPRILTVDLVPRLEGQDIAPFYGVDGAFSGEALPAQARRAWVEGCSHIEASSPVVQVAWEQAASDLASLQLLDGTDSRPYMIAAGIPNYTGLFGRDAYMTALQSATLNPMTLRGALQVLTPLNATETDDNLDAQPGKVLHQRQRGPLAKLGLTPYLHYYGDQSTPGLFLLAAAADLAHTGDHAFLRSLKDKLLGTLDWMEGNADSKGFYPYQTRSKQGIKNQSWKDSGEAVLYPDGTDVADPIAMADIQGLFYAGKQALGYAFAVVGETSLSDRLLSEAAALKKRFNEAFWMPDQGFFAIALDADKKRVESVADDPGACLAYGIVDDAKSEYVADRLMQDDLFSGWGIRTLSSRHPAYNPFAYHLGTVWPFSNAMAAYGLKRYGFIDHMHRVAEGLFSASQIFDLDRLPEVFGGHARDARHPHPGLYPGACSPQAWSAGTVILLVHTMLGLTPLAPRRTLVVDPALPVWLPEVTIRNVQVGSARAALRFRRDGSGFTDVEVLDSEGLTIVRPTAAPQGSDSLTRSIVAALDPAPSIILAGRR